MNASSLEKIFDFAENCRLQRIEAVVGVTVGAVVGASVAAQRSSRANKTTKAMRAIILILYALDLD